MFNNINIQASGMSFQPNKFMYS